MHMMIPFPSLGGRGRSVGNGAVTGTEMGTPDCGSHPAAGRPCTSTVQLGPNTQQKALGPCLHLLHSKFISAFIGARLAGTNTQPTRATALAPAACCNLCAAILAPPSLPCSSLSLAVRAHNTIIYRRRHKQWPCLRAAALLTVAGSMWPLAS
jgi:hypothetical protein